MTQTGDRCKKCREGQMRIRQSQRIGDGSRYVRYYQCSKCGASEKAFVDATNVIQRTRRLVTY